MIRSIVTLGRLSAAVQSRRHTTTFLLSSLPILFYAAIRSNDLASGAVALGIGSSWSAAALAAYGLQSNRQLDSRLCLAGLGSATIYLGRLASFATISVIGAALLSTIVALLEPELSWSTLMIGLMLAIIPALSCGMLIGVLAPSELEATLVILAIFGIPFGLSLDSTAVKYTPGFGSRKYLADLGSSLEWGTHILHPLGISILAICLATVVWRRRSC